MVTIMIVRSSDSNQRSAREFEKSYFHNPIVQAGELPPFIMLLKDMMSMESKGQPGVTPTASPLLSLQSADPFSVFCVSLPPHREIAQGVPFSRF
jgi:hypothetical protein